MWEWQRGRGRVVAIVKEIPALFREAISRRVGSGEQTKSEPVSEAVHLKTTFNNDLS